MKLAWARKIQLLVLLLLPGTLAWSSTIHRHPPSTRKSYLLLKAAAVGSEPDVLEGASTFEQWFRNVPGAVCNSEVSHTDFGNLRGLALSPEGKKQWTKRQGGEFLELMKIPKSIVLSSDFSRPDWDADLAQKLWMECTKGPSSSIAGYVALLTRGWTPADLPQLPPTTAPDALRHWTEEEKSVLASSPAGLKLLQLLEQQNQLWKTKFSNVRGMTFEQFEWAMEVVHSRAFCGDFGNSPLPPAVTAAVPLVAAAAGYQYFSQTAFPSDAVLLGLGVVAALPALFNLIQQNPPVAVLLPMIDSINHLEEAESNIEYSPLSNVFTLSVGKNCVIDEHGKTQLFISYGKKKDTELLLNYGFLRGVSSEGGTSARRKALAEVFLSRQ